MTDEALPIETAFESEPGQLVTLSPLVRRMTLPVYVDWLVNKVKTFSGRRVPPVHLVRRVVETCRNYHEAYDMLSKTPIALPAIFSLVGTERGELPGAGPNTGLHDERCVAHGRQRADLFRSDHRVPEGEEQEEADRFITRPIGHDPTNCWHVLDIGERSGCMLITEREMVEPGLGCDTTPLEK